jgi:hypothetical protein
MSGNSGLTPKEEFEARHKGRTSNKKKGTPVAPVSQPTYTPPAATGSVRTGGPSVILIASVGILAVIIIALVLLVPKIFGGTNGNDGVTREMAMEAFEKGDIAASKVIWSALDPEEVPETAKYISLCTQLLQKYEGIRPFHNEVAAVKTAAGMWGFIDMNGTEVIPCDYDEVMDFTSRVTAVCADGLCGFYDITGRKVRDLNYTFCKRRSDEAWVVDSISQDGTIEKIELTFPGD